MEHTISKEEMESLQALSDVNIKISEAKNLLFKLQEQETEYLVMREKKAIERIDKTIQDSAELVKVADQNYGQIKELYNGVLDFSSKLIKIQEEFKALQDDFEKKNEQWEKDIGRQQDEIAELTRNLNVKQVAIENDRKSMEIERAKLTEDQRKLESDRGLVDRTIKRLKENRI